MKLTGRLCQLGRFGTPDEVQPGDTVADELYWDWLEALPPATHKADLMQMGEAMDHRGPNGAPRFLTVQKHQGKWIYTGILSKGERVTFEAADAS